MYGVFFGLRPFALFQTYNSMLILVKLPLVPQYAPSSPRLSVISRDIAPLMRDSSQDASKIF